jgi:hypothetical protein
MADNFRYPRRCSQQVETLISKKGCALPGETKPQALRVRYQQKPCTVFKLRMNYVNDQRIDESEYCVILIHLGMGMMIGSSRL